MDMHHPEVPSWQRLVMRRLAGIPVRRDIAVLAAEYGQHLVPVRLQPDCRHVAATLSRRLAAMDSRAEKLARYNGIVASSVAVWFNGLHDSATPPQQATRLTQAPYSRWYLARVNRARRHLADRIIRNSQKKQGRSPAFGFEQAAFATGLSSASRTGSSGGLSPCRTSYARQHAGRGSGIRRPSAPDAGPARTASARG